MKLTKEEYINDPTGSSSLPFWKTNSFEMPSNIHVIRDDQYHGNKRGIDEPYFKLVNRLADIKEQSLPNGFLLYGPSLEDFVKHINECYEDIRVLNDELKKYEDRPTYRKSLWIGVKDIKTNKMVASIIGEVDQTISEGIIEWLQVSKEYRRKGLASFLVNLLLTRMSSECDFVTVSGQLYNNTHPYELYLSCGFISPVIWHIIRDEKNV